MDSVRTGILGAIRVRFEGEEQSQCERGLLFGHLAPFSLISVLGKAAGNDRLTGCLDEEPGPQYVLRGDQELRLLAVLEPQGFPVQSFAKYLGQRVRVTGSLSSQAGKSIMKVRAIKKLADFCRPKTPGESPGAATAQPPVLSPLKRAFGCLDEQPGPQYVLRDEREMHLLYELEPDGFAVQNFARFLGHKVELRGRTYSRNEKPVMKVRTIKNLADRCASHPPG